jgi:molybdopterin-guanine dinucleotide biosynthesis protein A
MSDPAHFGVSGFVLTGGQSSRMGRDKALLDFHGKPLAAYIAEQVAAVCGSATLVGSAERHGHLGFPVVSDLHSRIGPLGGIEAALTASPTPWVLIAACDMPGLSADFLRQLIDEAIYLEDQGRLPDALLPIGPNSIPNPLCALYHQRILPVVLAAIERGDYKVTRALETTKLCLLPVGGESALALANANTPEEWGAFSGH